MFLPACHPMVGVAGCRQKSCCLRATPWLGCFLQTKRSCLLVTTWLGCWLKTKRLLPACHPMVGLLHGSRRKGLACVPPPGVRLLAAGEKVLACVPPPWLGCRSSLSRSDSATPSAITARPPASSSSTSSQKVNQTVTKFTQPISHPRLYRIPRLLYRL